MSKIYKVPCGWEVYGYIEVTANSIDEAIKTVEVDNYFPLPNRTIFGKVKGKEPHRAKFSYVESSFEVDYAAIEEINKDDES